MSLTIYFADNDPDDRIFFRDSMMEIDNKAELFSFTHGGQLMQYLKVDPIVLPDIIFIDINMAVKDGHECLQEIRKDARFNKVAVVMFTTSINRNDVNLSFENGANLYVIKPPTLPQEIEILQEVFALYENDRLFKTSKEHFVLPKMLQII